MPPVRLEVEVGVGDDQRLARLAGGGGHETEHVAATAHVADLIVVDQATAVGGGQDLEREPGQVAVGGDQEACATPECRGQRVE
jgi:hypothetical protein